MNDEQKAVFNEHASALIHLISTLNPHLTIVIDCTSAELLCGEYAYEIEKD